MRIHFERSGGIMGRKISLDLDASDLPPAEAESLRQAFDATDFFDLPENMLKMPMPDEMQYLVTLETANMKHTVRASDSSAPPALSALLQSLSQYARARTKK